MKKTRKSPAAASRRGGTPASTSPAYAARATSPAYAARATSPAYAARASPAAARAPKPPPKPKSIEPSQYATAAGNITNATFKVPLGMSIVFLVHPGTWEWSLPSGGLLGITSLTRTQKSNVGGADMVSIGGQLVDVYRHGEKVPDVRVGTATAGFPLPNGPPAAAAQTARLSEMVEALAGLSSKGLTVVVGPPAART